MRYILMIGALVLGAVGYSLFWWWSANGVETYLQSLRDQPLGPNARVNFSALEVNGYPYRLVANFTEPEADIARGDTLMKWQGPRLTAYTHPWTPDHLVADFSGAHRFRLHHQGGNWPLDLVSQKAMASRIGPMGQLGRISIDLQKNVLRLPLFAKEIRVDRLRLHARDRIDASEILQLAIKAEGASLPADLLAGLPQSDLQLAELIVKLPEPLPEDFSPRGLARWRDDGGALEVERLDIRWPDLRLDVTGTLALDQELRAVGALTARIAGIDAFTELLIAQGAVSADRAGLLKAGLQVLASSNGGELRAPVRLQDGLAWLGPIRIARLRPLFPDGGQSQQYPPPDRLQ